LEYREKLVRNRYLRIGGKGVPDIIVEEINNLIAITGFKE